jgi:ABC-type lipoprotein export system ATPase subunit
MHDSAWTGEHRFADQPVRQLSAKHRAKLHKQYIEFVFQSWQGRELMELFRRLNEEGTTMVQVTHSEQNAAYGSRIIRLADG